MGVLPPEIFSGSEYATPVVPVSPEVGAVIAAAATIGPLAAEISETVPALFVAVAFRRT